MRADINIDVDSFNRKIEECKDFGYDIDKTLEEVRDSMSIDVLTAYADGRAEERIVKFVFD